MHPNIIKSAGIITGLIIFSLGLVFIAAAAGDGKPAPQSKASVLAPVSPAGVKSAKVIAPPPSPPLTAPAVKTAEASVSPSAAAGVKAPKSLPPPPSGPPSFGTRTKPAPVEEISRVIQPTPQGKIVIGPEEKKEQSLSLKKKLERKGSFKFSDEDLRLVLRSLAKAYRFNITLAPEVQGKVTVDFHDVKVVNSLDIILKDQGFGYQINGDILRVTTLEKLKQEEESQAVRNEASAKTQAAAAAKRKAQQAAEPLEIKVYTLKFIDANDAKDAIAPLITAGRGKVMVLKTQQYTGFEFEATEKFAAEGGARKEDAAFVRSRTLIVQDIQSVLDRIGKVIKNIDQRPPQIMIDAKILEVPIDREYRLGINWTNALNQWNVGAKDLSAIFDKGYSTSHIRSDSRTQGDSRQNEVVNEIIDSYEDERTDSSSRAYNWTLQNDSTGWSQAAKDEIINLNEAVRTSQFSTLDSNKTTNLVSYIANISDTLTKISGASQAYSAILTAADFNLMISAMKTDSNIVVLSNPRVIVHENYAAKIFVGERYPILKTEVSGDSGGTVGGTSVDEWREIGITLKVIPQVREKEAEGEGKTINMIVHPAVSSRTGNFAEFRDSQGNLSYSSYPIIDIREADTNVTINNGDTIVIGGLISSRTVDEEDKIPLLGDIPILGYLFKEKHTQLKKRNLLIFITARIVTEEMELSAYEKIMLMKSPPDALGDLEYVEDDQVRPYLFRSSKEPPTAEEQDKEGEEVASESREDSGNRGAFQGRRKTRAMKRSRYR